MIPRLHTQICRQSGYAPGETGQCRCDLGGSRGERSDGNSDTAKHSSLTDLSSPVKRLEERCSESKLNKSQFRLAMLRQASKHIQIMSILYGLLLLFW